MMDNAAKSLLDILEEERAALLQSQYDVLDTLLEKKTKLFENLDEDLEDLEDAERIEAAMKRNHRLIGAAIRGINEARKRLGDAQMAQGTLSTYTQSGTRNEIVSTTPRMTRKA